MGKKSITILCVIILTMGLVGCKSTKDISSESISRTELFMGTAIKITLYDNDKLEILDKAFKRILEIENLVTINKEESEVTTLNKNAGIKGIKLSDTSYDIIEKGLYYSSLSQGDYDITIGPLVKLWSIGLPDAKVPSKEEIHKTIKNVDYSKVKMDNNTNEVFLSDEGMVLDLGSIAKGYAADEVVKLFKKEDIKKAIIDIGGNIYALGEKEKNKGWKVGIQNPFDDRGNVVGSIEISDKSVVTSGIYERFIEKDGTKYHHILNPKTGYPYDTEIVGVSIIADNSIDADALSTLIFTKGLNEGIKFVNKLENIDAVFITDKKEVYITNGIKDNFKIMNNEFKLIS